MKALLPIIFSFISLLLLTGASSSSVNENAIKLGKQRLLNEAVSELDQAINIADKKAARYYHNKGWALELKGNYSGALKNYRKALDRNKYQLVTAERLGFLYYRTGDYDNAVKTGEYVLKLDPANTRVMSWLEDAYKKQKNGKKKDPNDPVQKEREDLNRDRNNYMEFQRQKEMNHIITITIDVMMRTALFYKENPARYTYRLDHGLFIDLPETIYVHTGPFKGWTFDVWAENPWLGASIPDVNIQTYGFECAYHFKTFYLGAGIIFGQYWSDMSFNKLLDLWDFKVGFIFGFDFVDFDLKFYLYPRLLWADYPGTPGYGYDIGHFRIDYEHIINSRFTIFASFYARDYFLFDHAGGVSNYWGTADVVFGTRINFFKGKGYDPFFRISLSLTERIYLRDLNNTNPYAFGNGQGFLGLNIDKFATGWPLSGLWGLGHIITVRFDEYIKPYLFLYESIILEFSDWKEDSFEFNFQLGLGINL